jgi:WD40 repeat protein
MADHFLIWILHSYQAVRSGIDIIIGGHGFPSVNFLPNGKLVAESGSNDQTIYIWDARTAAIQITYLLFHVSYKLALALAAK